MKIIDFLHKIAHYMQRKIQCWLGLITIGPRAIVLNEKQQILLVKHTYQIHWYLPGGGLKKGESVKVALLRELKEEIGLTSTEEPQLFGIYHHTYLNVNDYPVIYIVKQFTLEQCHSPEIEEIAWFDYDKLPETVSPGTKRRLTEYFSSAVKSEKW